MSEVSRRGALALVAGSAVGTMFAGRPAKAADETAPGSGVIAVGPLRLSDWLRPRDRTSGVFALKSAVSDKDLAAALDQSPLYVIDRWVRDKADGIRFGLSGEVRLAVAGKLLHRWEDGVRWFEVRVLEATAAVNSTYYPKVGRPTRKVAVSVALDIRGADGERSGESRTSVMPPAEKQVWYDLSGNPVKS